MPDGNIAHLDLEQFEDAKAVAELCQELAPLGR